MTDTQKDIIRRLDKINDYMDPTNPEGFGKRTALLHRSTNDMQKGISWMLPTVIVLAVVFGYVLIDGVYSLSQITT